jgi:hypothetical protein
MYDWIELEEEPMLCISPVIDWRDLAANLDFCFKLC